MLSVFQVLLTAGAVFVHVSEAAPYMPAWPVQKHGRHHHSRSGFSWPTGWPSWPTHTRHSSSTLPSKTSSLTLPVTTSSGSVPISPTSSVISASTSISISLPKLPVASPTTSTNVVTATQPSTKSSTSASSGSTKSSEPSSVTTLSTILVIPTPASPSSEASVSTSLSSSSASASATAPSSTILWKPKAGTTWQIELSNVVTDTSYDAEVFDMDLFDNPKTTIDALHALGRKAICYFSAGTYEDWREDYASFNAADLGAAMDDWPGESWIDTNSENVRAIMTKRIGIAVEKGCDGIDPDNVDAYNNDNGLSLTSADAIDYLTFLADTAHANGLSIGLKNAAEIVADILPKMEWQVNEQCIEHDECNTFTPFIEADKPVFHIEYPSGAGSSVSDSVKSTDCGAPAGFSSILKSIDLNEWIETC